MTKQERQLNELGLEAEIQHYRYFEADGEEYLDLSPNGGNPLPYGGLTVADIFLEDGRIYSGVAACSIKDNYNKRIGRAIAIGRALKEMEQDETAR